jgi:integrative and conjugative element protein (TIGR02256 family)
MPGFNVDNLNDLAEISYSRSKSLINAISNNEYFEYHGAKLLDNKDVSYAEVLIVTLTCDGVPDANTFGINYRERLGIVVNSDENNIPEVWTLREDFPNLPHMNGRLASMPNNICLYFENKTVINRSWTAEKFLKRIYWWIEQSAKGELHVADQPVEQFFFISKYELVLPKECGQNLENINGKFFISRIVDRANGAKTFFLELKKPEDTGLASTHLIYIELPPVTHGTISPSPHTLNELCDTTSTTKFSTKNFIKAHIQSLVPQSGVAIKNDDSRTIFIVKIPITRERDGSVEKVQLQAFISISSPYEIGLNMGFLFQSPDDSKLYKETNFLGGGARPTEEIELLQVEVLKMNSKEDFNDQSGYTTTGGKYVLVGLGALGSALIDLWSRAGWGEWSLIDKDHIKPHNLTRHTASCGLVGWNKAKACAALINNSTGTDDSLSVYDADVLANNQDIECVLSGKNLVIDVTTTLDYPRLASFKDAYSRHCSLFITPSGTDSVLLLEDERRAYRLRTLEAQYYRAILNNDWGEKHLSGNMGHFISGASCRDISLKLPFSSVMCHAAMLSEQIMKLCEKHDPQILVWQRDKSMGCIDLKTITVSREISNNIGKYQVFFDKGLEEKLNVMREQNLPTETGGILLGYHDLNLNAIFIVDALPAPSDSISTETEFQRGTIGTIEAVKSARAKTAHIVDYIGEWHSHPENVPVDPSEKDVMQLTELSKLLSEDGLPAIQLIVGSDMVNIIIGEIVSV